mgnify:CR=1 FL=1
MLMTPAGVEQMVAISKQHPNQTSPVERALRFHADKSALAQVKKNQFTPEAMADKGCTANVLMLIENTLICANAGDSRCVLGEGGRALPMSTDHKPTQKRERDRIYRAGSTVNFEGRIDGNLNLSRAIGDISHKRNAKLPLHEQAITALPDIKTHQMSSKTDFAIMGCDGIWETKTSQQIVDYVYIQMQRKVKLAKICEGLLDSLLSPNVMRTDGKGCDNMSVIIIDFRQ